MWLHRFWRWLDWGEAADPIDDDEVNWSGIGPMGETYE